MERASRDCGSYYNQDEWALLSLCFSFVCRQWTLRTLACKVCLLACMLVPPWDLPFLASWDIVIKNIWRSQRCEVELHNTNSADEILCRVSIKFEVGSQLEKSNRLFEEEAVGPLNLGRSRGLLPQKILKSGSSEMPFPAFWAPNYQASTSGNYSVCMAIRCEII